LRPGSPHYTVAIASTSRVVPTNPVDRASIGRDNGRRGGDRVPAAQNGPEERQDPRVLAALAVGARGPTRAHIFVCFLAYALWKTLELWQSQAGLGNSPRAILEELAQVQSADVLLPTTDGRELRVRCVVRPNEAQAQLLDRLGIELPRRLTIPKPPANPLV
jgi:hypothetical protein